MISKTEGVLWIHVKEVSIDACRMVKNISGHGCNKHISVYSKGRECPGSEKTALNNVR